MKKERFFKVLCALLLLVLTAVGCDEKKFEISGSIGDAKDSLLFFEHMSLSGAVVVDSVKLGDDGAFSFKGDRPESPEFYRLRIGQQIINIAIDSTETVGVKASYPTMSSRYEVEGSEECEKIRELALLQIGLQAAVNNIARNTELSTETLQDSIQATIEEYKESLKQNYIFKEPMKAYAYFALFQTIRLGYMEGLLFNPRADEKDVKVFAAVATCWDAYYPGTERGENLHNIALEGLKDVRILKAEKEQTIDPKKVTVAGVIDVALPDNKGVVRHLNEMGGKVVLLDFHVFAMKESTERIMMLRDLYNKYHAQGLEIFQVSLDTDEHFWKTKTAALPWISVRDEKGMDSPYLMQYNLSELPTFFLIDKNNVLYKRDTQIQDLDAEIQTLLK